MIDFSRIHSFQLGQRFSFEELVCQLAFREAFPDGSEYRRVEGSGGDGGVESYWLKPDGSKSGYQAKYFLRTGDIDWTQMDNSVSQAIVTHNTLSEFVFAIPCDLTDRAGKKGKGKKGWEHWETHVSKWKSQAAQLGNTTIQFTLWAQSDLLCRLTRSDAAGLREYWFGDIEFSKEWFKGHVRESIASLDERYHPEDHVDVRIQQLFLILTRDQFSIAELENKLSLIKECSFSAHNFSDLSSKPDSNILLKLSEAYRYLLDLNEEFFSRPSKAWKTKKWIQLTNDLLALVDKLADWCWEDKRELKEDSPEKHHLRKCRRDINSFRDAIAAFHSLCASSYMKAEQNRVAFVTGRAGTGKSHLLGQVAANSVSKERPVFFVLGQRLNSDEPWTQLANLLQLPGKPADVLLGALDAAGEAKGTRTLLLVDAINEGPGARYWQNHIAGFVEKISKYKHIACVISCRTEYFSIAIPPLLRDKFPSFEIRGFETAEEQLNAARVFLDRRGIARPSTPWLAPEFINPLFLRSVCVALERDRRSEFPAGLHGTRKILSYYLDSIGNNITVTEGSLISLASAVKQSVVAIAAAMITDRVDYLALDDAEQIISGYFQSSVPKSETSWLTVFLSNGLLRRDPNPCVIDDPLCDTEDVVRFSFQRFQDFLMGETLVTGVENPTELFGESGRLSFILDGNQLAWQWRGVFEALSSIVPEQFGFEVVDLLPGGKEKWWHFWDIQEAFVESIQWRERNAFSDRSLELLNTLSFGTHPSEVLIMVSVSTDHPWNAELLHRNLFRRKLAERDAFWTVWLNQQSDDVESPVGRLLDWCLSGQVPQTNQENQFLAALTLCWFFTSSNRRIRDRATKALTALFIARSNLFPALLERFKNVDDLYVFERLLAAAYGASCRDQSSERLKSYSREVFQSIFSDGTPPLALLLRDYAFGIIELAQYHGMLPKEVDYALCQPPYKSKSLRFSITEEKLQQLAKKAGGREILRSATGVMGDFGIYEISPRINHFLALPLTKKAPLTSEQRFKVFEENVISISMERIWAFEKLRKNSNPYSYGLLQSFYDSWENLEQSELDAWHREIEFAEQRLLTLLTGEEAKWFRRDAAPELYNRNKKERKLPLIDNAAAQRWVANRAYRMGWTVNRFKIDDSQVGGSYLRDRPLTERIGKKYQWLALDELMCRLADHCWLSGNYGNRPKPYSSRIDVDYHLDIDPTIIEQHISRDLFSWTENSWVAQPNIHLVDVSENHLPAWPFQVDPADELKNLIVREDGTGTRWVVLYEHQSKTERYEGDRVGEHGTRQQEFRFLMPVIVRKDEVNTIVNKLKAEQTIDIHDWSPHDLTDEGFLFETPWRATWPGSKWRSHCRGVPVGVQITFPVARYCWESHLDASLPEGFSTHLPAPWLARELDLKPKISTTGNWYTTCGDLVFRTFSGEEGGTICLMPQCTLDKILGDELCFLSIYIAERNAWPGGNNTNASWRRSEGVCWYDGQKLHSVTWKCDNGNGTSAKLVKQNIH